MEKRTLNYILVSLLTLFIVFTFLHFFSICGMKNEYIFLINGVNLGIFILLGLFAYRGILVFPESKFSTVIFVLLQIPLLLPVLRVLFLDSNLRSILTNPYSPYSIPMIVWGILVLLISLFSLHFYSSSSKISYAFRISGVLALLTSARYLYLLLAKVLVCAGPI